MQHACIPSDNLCWQNQKWISALGCPVIKQISFVLLGKTPNAYEILIIETKDPLSLTTKTFRSNLESILNQFKSMQPLIFTSGKNTVFFNLFEIRIARAVSCMNIQRRNFRNITKHQRNILYIYSAIM